MTAPQHARRQPNDDSDVWAGASPTGIGATGRRGTRVDYLARGFERISQRAGRVRDS
jgi:hypothetical protein